MNSKQSLLRPLCYGLLAIGVGLPGLVTAQTLDQRVERLERMANNPVLMQHSQRMNDQQREIQSLYDEIDRLKNQLRGLETRLAKQYQEMDERLHQLQAKTPVVRSDQSNQSSQNNAVQAPAVAAPTTATATLSVEPERKAYDAAFALMREARYAESIDAFKAFVATYPKGQLASNGYYWMGEAHLIQQQFAPAYDAFSTLLKNYANSDKVEDALLRGGDSLVGLKRMDEAKAMYQDLIKRFPQGRAAQSAQTRLERFKTGG